MNFLSREKVTETAVLNGVANPSSAPALIVLNIFNALNWEKCLTQVILILTALILI